MPKKYVMIAIFPAELKIPERLVRARRGARQGGIVLNEEQPPFPSHNRWAWLALWAWKGAQRRAHSVLTHQCALGDGVPTDQKSRWQRIGIGDHVGVTRVNILSRTVQAEIEMNIDASIVERLAHQIYCFPLRQMRVLHCSVRVVVH